MTFPQRPASDAVLQKQDIWRLFTPLESSGDIYEADVSALALAVGPNSDIGRVAANYYDPLEADLASVGEFSVDKPWIGRMDARPSQKYQSGDPAKILISSVDLVPPIGFRPPSAGANDPVETVRPNLDVLFYITKQTGLDPSRSDRLHLFEQVPNPLSSDPQWILLPFYNRRFAEVVVKNLDLPGAGPCTVNVYGINFSNIITNTGILADVGHQQDLLSSITSIAAGSSDSTQVINRAFDYLALEMFTDAGGNFVDAVQLVTQIVTSDRI